MGSLFVGQDHYWIEIQVGFWISLLADRRSFQQEKHSTKAPVMRQNTDMIMTLSLLNDPNEEALDDDDGSMEIQQQVIEWIRCRLDSETFERLCGNDRSSRNTSENNRRSNNSTIDDDDDEDEQIAQRLLGHWIVQQYCPPPSFCKPFINRSTTGVNRLPTIPGPATTTSLTMIIHPTPCWNAPWRTWDAAWPNSLRILKLRASTFWAP